MTRYLRLPSSEVLLAPDVGARGVEDPPLAPLQPGTPRVHFLQRDLVHARQPVRLGVPDGRGIVAEELFTISSSISCIASCTPRLWMKIIHLDR